MRFGEFVSRVDRSGKRDERRRAEKKSPDALSRLLTEELPCCQSVPLRRCGQRKDCPLRTARTRPRLVPVEGKIAECRPALSSLSSSSP